jgi:prepilin-type processing-associated H-X9-DG protein
VSYGRNGRIRVRRFDDIRDQARFPIVLDALLAQASTFADASGRHAGSANMLYMDSHVESVVLSALAVAGAAPLPGYPPGYDFLISFRVSGKYWSKLDVTLLQDGTGVSSLTLNSAGSAKNQQYFEMPVALLDPWRSSYAIRLRLTTSDKKHNTSVSIRVADQAYDRLATLDMSAPEATVDITADLRSALPPGAG